MYLSREAALLEQALTKRRTEFYLTPRLTKQDNYLDIENSRHGRSNEFGCVHTAPTEDRDAVYHTGETSYFNPVRYLWES